MCVSVWFQDLHGSILAYLEDLGITEEMSAFVAEYATYKEQREYEDWLQNMLKFVRA
jgi:complement component 1 Q subcomponent-binding protein